MKMFKTKRREKIEVLQDEVDRLQRVVKELSRNLGTLTNDVKWEISKNNYHHKIKYYVAREDFVLLMDYLNIEFHEEPAIRYIREKDE